MPIDKNMNILVVDDSKSMLSLTSSLLRQMGFNNIETAISGAQALEKMKTCKFNLFLLDWNMDVMTGLELLKIIREKPVTATIPVIMVTAESKIENIVAAKKAGATNYIVKPFTTLILKEKLAAVFGDFQ